MRHSGANGYPQPDSDGHLDHLCRSSWGQALPANVLRIIGVPKVRHDDSINLNAEFGA